MDKIVCVGKNYLEHAKELGDAVPAQPVLFIKPPSVLRAGLTMGETLEVALPSGKGAIHPECEIVLRLRCGGARLSLDAAQDCIGQVTLGLDMTLRDRQAELKRQGHPWTVSKVFADSAIIGPWLSLKDFPDYLDSEFSFSVGGTLRQRGKGKQMSFTPAQCVALASESFPLCSGDLIFTGTPAGVGPVLSGDHAELSWGKLRYGVTWK